jgi:soluble lytic murein transglycosylase-like protein
MSRYPGILALLLVVLAWGSPAAAAIERYTDASGIIHIRTSAAKASQPRLEPMAAVHGPAGPGNFSAVAADPASPGQTKPEQLAVGEQSASGAPAPSPLASGLSLSRPVGVNPAIATATSKVPEQMSPAIGPAGLNLQKVAWTPPAARVSLRPRMPAPPRESQDLDGSIKHFRDRHGVLHITNLPAAEPTGPARLLAAKPNSPAAPAEPATSPGAAIADSQPPLQRVSCQESESGLIASGVGHGGRSAPAMPGTIKRYRDANGVVHIDNTSPQPQEDGFEQMLLARASQNIASRMARRFEAYLSPTDGGLPAGLTVRNAAWTGEGALGKPQSNAAKTRKPQKQGAWAGETVKRYRDAKGTLHITSIAPDVPRGVLPAPPQLAAKAANGFSGRNLGGPEMGPQVAPADPPNNNSGAAGVMAYRDRQGKMVIANRAPAPPLKIPRPPAVDSGATAYEAVIAEASQTYGLPAALIKAVIKVESNFVPWAVSPKGAMGMMQLMPGTANFLGVREPFNPRENIHGGCKYLRMLMNYFGGNIALALAGYNAGYQRVVQCGFKVPAIKETQDFVTNVLGRYYAAENQALWPWT